MTRELYSSAGIAVMRKRSADKAIELFVYEEACAPAYPDDAVNADTAGELRAAGGHRALTADALEESDEESRAALERHSREVASIAAPDQGPPAPPEIPSRSGPGHPQE